MSTLPHDKTTILSMNPTAKGDINNVEIKPIADETFNGIVVIGKPIDVATWLNLKVDELSTAKPVDRIYVGQNDGMGNPYAAVFLVHEIGNGQVNLSDTMIEAFVPNAEQAVALNSASSYGKVMAPDTAFRPLMEVVFSNDPAWVTTKVIEAATLVLTSLYDLNGNVFGTTDHKLRLGIEKSGQTRVTVSPTAPQYFKKEPITPNTFISIDPVDGTKIEIDGDKNMVRAQPYAHNLLTTDGEKPEVWSDWENTGIELKDGQKLGRVVDYDDGNLTINVLNDTGDFSHLAKIKVKLVGDYVETEQVGSYNELDLGDDGITIHQVVGLGYDTETIGVMGTIPGVDGDKDNTGYTGYFLLPVGKIPCVDAAYAA